MQLLYVDESGDGSLPKTPTDPFKNSEYFIRVGVAFHDKRWAKINSTIDKFRNSFNLPSDLEIHATEVLYGKKQKTIVQNGKKKKIKTLNWFGQNIKNSEDRKKFLQSYLEQIFKCNKLQVMAVIIHKKRINLNKVSPQHIARNPKLKSLELLTERFNYFISKSIDQLGMIVMDSVNSEDNEIHHSFQKFLYQNSNHITSHHFIESLMFAPSHYSNLLQLADVCAFAIKRKWSDNDDFLYSKIANNIFSVDGKTNGCGIKEWPLDDNP